MTTKSQKQARLIVISVITILIIIPLTIFLMFMLLRKPVAVDNKQNTTNQKQNNIGLVKSLINFKYKAPNDKWQTKIIKEQKNKLSGVKSIEFEITNGVSSMNVLIDEVDLRYLGSSGVSESTINKELSDKYYQYVELDKSNIYDIQDNTTAKYSRTKNLRLGTGQIIYNSNKTTTIKGPDGKDKLVYSSTLNMFDDYSKDYKLYSLNVQVTYKQDSEENYKVLDNIFKTLDYTSEDK
jgi:hypothetical protein